MTIDLPVDSPKGNVLPIDLTGSFIGADKHKNILNQKTSEPNKIPVVVLKKCDDDNKYYVVSPRSSNRRRTVKSFEGFEMDLSATNLKEIGDASVSLRKRERPKKIDNEPEMLSPKKLQKTQEKSQNEQGDQENSIETLCIALKKTVKLTPVKKPKNVELIENSLSPKQKISAITPKSGRGRFHNGSPLKTDENGFQGVSPEKLVKLNLEESFRRSVLKSKLNLENGRKDACGQSGIITRGSVAKQSTPTKSNVRSSRTVRQSYAQFFYYDNDSDEEIQKHKNQNEKGVFPKRRILRSHSSSSNSVDLPLDIGSQPEDDNYAKDKGKRLKNESESNISDNQLEDDSETHKIVHPITPSRRKSVLRSKKDSTSSSFSENSEVSPQRAKNKVAKTSGTRRNRIDSATSNASDKSPKRRPLRAATKTPNTPRNRRPAVATPRSVKTTPKTPKNRLKLLRNGVITPSMQSRSSIIPGDSTPLMKARSQLHVSYVPTSLPCREKEYLDIYNFLRGKLDDGYGGCMYISGVPGTGKTATVTSVINNLQNDKKMQEFSYVSVNGMRLTEPRQSYVEIWKQLTGKTIPWEQAQSLLEERFTKKKNFSPVVMLIDELDILCTKRQDVVYNLLDWPSKSKDQLVVITIANTMDLPERLLMSRVTSRLGLTRLTFQAYTHKQLMEIVSKRLTGTNSFNPDAIQLVARKVASVSGDARRALDICRRAAEIAEDEGKGQLVNIMHINEAVNAMITQPQVMAIKRCSRLQKLLLQAIVAEIERTGVEETTFSDVFRILVSCCALDGFKMVSSTVAQRAVSELSAYRLIITDQKCSSIYQRIILNVSVHDVYFALKKE